MCLFFDGLNSPADRRVRSRSALPSHLDQDALNLIQAYIITAAIVELGGSGRRMIGNIGSFFKRSAILEIGSDPRGTERVIANSRY